MTMLRVEDQHRAVDQARRLLASAAQDTRLAAGRALQAAADDFASYLRGPAVAGAPQAYRAVYAAMARAADVDTSTTGTWSMQGVVVRVPGDRVLSSTAMLGQLAFGYEFGAKTGDLAAQARGEAGAGPATWLRVQTSNTRRTRLVRADRYEEFKRHAEAQYVLTVTKVGKDGRTRRTRRTVAGAEGGEQVRVGAWKGKGRKRRFTADATARPLTQFPPRSRRGWWAGPAFDTQQEQLVTAFVVAVDQALGGDV